MSGVRVPPPLPPFLKRFKEKVNYLMQMYVKIKYFMMFAAAFLFITGCGLEDLADYSTPRATYESYILHSKTLRIVADHRSYRRAVRCFTDEDRSWFESNFTLLKDLPWVEVEEDIYRHLYKTKRQAYLFGRAVVPAGPDLYADYEIRQLSDDEAVIAVEGFEDEIEMVKTSWGWQMKGLFGIREKVQE